MKLHPYDVAFCHRRRDLRTVFHARKQVLFAVRCKVRVDEIHEVALFNIFQNRVRLMEFQSVPADLRNFEFSRYIGFNGNNLTLNKTQPFVFAEFVTFIKKKLNTETDPEYGKPLLIYNDNLHCFELTASKFVCLSTLKGNERVRSKLQKARTEKVEDVVKIGDTARIK